uniref:Uncharacterized protein n=1 Tax=uncultured prokaryote TaxID=198431 RepID=A0A0H5Q358_9ZZZZ|nr:hypothetical protein [uncultured prokaryote]
MPKSTPREEAALRKMDANPNAPRYVTCDLSKAQKDALVDYINTETAEALLEWIERRVGDNHTLSIKSLDVGFQCSLTGTTKQTDHANMCLISRASTGERAIFSVMFKDAVLLKGVWPITNRLDDLDA